jgi:2-desacetyl-2-hydroxyethyl bacteriochlorophyllide A dehydrogenase
MLAVVTQGNGAVEVTDAPKPTVVEPDDVIVKVTAAAVCGTDLHFVRHPFLPPALTLGHEFIGTVVETGTQVHHVTEGQRVLSKMFVACGRCKPCRTANQPRCAEYRLFGGGILDGGQAEYVRVPRADFTLSELDASVSDQDALVLTDILPTAWEALVKTGFQSGATVGVVGSGPVGLLIAQLALARGAAAVYLVDLDQRRLKQAEKLGAVPVPGGEGAAERVLELTGGNGVDVAIDAVGAIPAISTALACVALGGTVGLVGVLLDGDLPVTAQNLFGRQVTIVPVTGNPYAANDNLTTMITAGRIQPGIVIDHEAPLSAAAETYRSFMARDFVKTILRP